jgi:hypothetical protein
VKFLAVVGLLCCALAGCNRATQNKEAIRQSVVDYVSTKVNVGSMDVEVTSVTFKGNEADATVDFRAKGSPAGSGLEMHYTLEQKSGKWVVKDKAEASGNPHGAMPNAGGGGALPPGHPSMGGGEAKK